MASAINQWQIDAMASREPRLKASIVVPYEDGEAARAEIHRCAGNKDYVQVFLLSRTAEALGRRRYWPNTWMPTGSPCSTAASKIGQ